MPADLLMAIARGRQKRQVEVLPLIRVLPLLASFHDLIDYAYFPNFLFSDDYLVYLVTVDGCLECWVWADLELDSRASLVENALELVILRHRLRLLLVLRVTRPCE